MGYGVTKQWAAQPGRARAAGTRKAKSTRTAKRKRPASARRAPKKSPAKKRTKPAPKARASKPRAPKKKKAPKAKKARLYTRYDPETGQKVRVPNTSFEYYDWPSRKPSKKKVARAAFKADPIGTTGTLAQTAAKRAVERSAERVSSQVLRRATPVAVGAAGALARAGGVAAAALPPLGVVGAIAAAGILGGWLMDKATDSTGDKINRISLAFVAAQQELMKRTGTTSWAKVPEAPRNKLIAEYKAALAHVAKNPGLARFEKTPTFGR